MKLVGKADLIGPIHSGFSCVQKNTELDGTSMTAIKDSTDRRCTCKCSINAGCRIGSSMGNRSSMGNQSSGLCMGSQQAFLGTSLTGLWDLKCQETRVWH